MISVVIPTLNAAQSLPETLSALIPATVAGVVKEVIISDGGSHDETLALADAAGATIIEGACGRGQQLAAGAKRARQPWMLFLHADTRLEAGWEDEAVDFLKRMAALRDLSDGGAMGAQAVTPTPTPTPTRTSTPATTECAAAFQLRFDDSGLRPRLLEWGVGVRCRLFGLAYGDQGLLIARAHYDEIGGFRPLQLMEDVDIVQRIGKRRLKVLRARAVTSAHRYRSQGYARRVVRNWWCLTMYLVGVPVPRIAKWYANAPDKSAQH